MTTFVVVSGTNNGKIIQSMVGKFIKIGPYINWAGLSCVPGHKIAYLEFGDPSNSNVIVCAHGLTRNAHDFDKIAGELSKNFRVIAIDYPGRGSSDLFENSKNYNYRVYLKDTVLLLKELGIKQCIWLGTSMGGIIGMVMASRYPKLFKALVINDVGPFISSAPLVKIGNYAKQKKSFSTISECKEHLKLIYAPFGISSEEDWDHMTKYSFRLTDNGKYVMSYDPAIVSGMKSSSGKAKDVNLWFVWNKINCKMLVVHGAKSDILQQPTIDQMKKTKDFDLYVVGYAGHAPSLMSYDQIDHVKSWINSL